MASDAEIAATARVATVGRFGKRKARAEQRTAAEHANTVREQVRSVWGAEPPPTAEALPVWAARQAANLAERNPRVLDTTRAVETATSEAEALRKRQERERTELLVSEYGPTQALRVQNGMGAISPHRNARDAATRAAAARQEIEELRGLPVAEAAVQLDVQHAAAEEARRLTAERARRRRDPFDHDSGHTDPHRDGPSRSL